jgi:hypothetical protein
MSELTGTIEYTCVDCLSKSDIALDLHHDPMTYIECDCGERCEPTSSEEIQALFNKQEVLITYELLDKNSNRYMRAKGHAKFMIFEDGKKIEWLWMTNSDIKANAKNNPTQRDVLFTGLMG